MLIGLLRLELFLPDALSLKDKRSVLKSIKDQLRNRFNIAVAELESSEKWQRAVIGVITVGDDRRYIDGCLSQVVNWVQASRMVELVRVEHQTF